MEIVKNCSTCSCSVRLVQQDTTNVNEKIKNLGNIIWCDKNHCSKKPTDLCEYYRKRKVTG